MNERIKLNLGCGRIYKPGYINIDKFDNSVADEISDICDLPFKSNSIDLIEAFQVIEHFDYIHCKYILSEWFRVLKPNGKLIIETPDMEKAFKKFISTDIINQKTTLQWIYGIDSPGMLHKTGFTFNLLKDLLMETGFSDVLRKRQKTHLYEHGMRIVCKKPEGYGKGQILAYFRKRVLNEISDNSYILIPLENWIEILIDSYRKFDKDKNKDVLLDKLISKTAICNPRIPLIFLEECLKCGVLKKSEIVEEIDFLNFLKKERFHERIFTLWMKRRKDIGGMHLLNVYKSGFLLEIERLILDILKDKLNYRERLDYIINLKPTNTLIFDFDLILLEANKLFNLGIKQFYKKDFTNAMDSFIRSSKMNPVNPMVYWNIARLGCILKFKKYKIVDNYKKTLKLLRDNRVKEELKNVEVDRIHLIPKQPVIENG